MDRTGESLRQLSKRATEGGHPLHHATFGKLANESSRTEFPEMSTVYAVATALGISASEVAMAAIESMGLDIEGHSADTAFARQFVTITSRLTPSAIKHVLSVTRTMAEALEQQEGSSGRGAGGPDDDVQS